MLYSLGLFIFIGMVIGIFLILNWGHTIVNLTETIQFIVILSPFIILYIQNIKEKKARNERLRIIIDKITYLISDIYEGKEILKEFKEKGKFRNLFVPLGRLTLKTEEKYMIEIIKLHISNLRNFSLSELAKISCRFDNPMNYSISILNKYQIGLFGIKNIIENEDLTENEEKINEIYYELIKLI